MSNEIRATEEEHLSSEVQPLSIGRQWGCGCDVGVRDWKCLSGTVVQRHLL